MTATFYRIVTIGFSLGGVYQILMTLAATAFGSGNWASSLILLSSSALPVYFVWRHYETLVKKTDFLPASLLEERPRYFNLCIAILGVVSVSYLLTRLVALGSVVFPQPGMPGMLIGNVIFGLIQPLMTPALFGIELGVWYHRGMRSRLAA